MRLSPLPLFGLCLSLTTGTVLAKDSFGSLKEAAKAQAGAKMAETLNIPSTAPAGSKVYFLAPANNATVTSPVTVVFGLTGMGVAPAGTQIEGTGHHHLLIDNPTVDLSLPLPASEQVVHFGKGQTETQLTLKPGTHTLQLVFGDWKHQPFNPTVASDKITITVK